MSNKIFIKPGEGRRVRRESDGRLISEEGESVENTSYIKRRLRDGDLVVSKPLKKVIAEVTK